MVKLGPDLYTGSDSYSGYAPTGNFTGFTMLHESGTGGAPKYGVVSQMPVVGDVTNPLGDAMNDTRAKDDVTEVGYYKASLGSGTVLEMAATEKAGIYQYTFPNSKTKNVLVDVSHVLSSYRGQGLEQHYLAGNISVVPVKKGSKTLKYTGWGTYDNVSESQQLENIQSHHIRDGIEPPPGQSTSAATSTHPSHTGLSWAKIKQPTTWPNSPTNQATSLKPPA